MTQAANTYAQALYDLAKDEDLGKTILEELVVLKEIFAQNPQYSKLLSAPDIPKRERCVVLDEAFKGKVHPYVLNLTEKGYIRQFPDCCDAYRGFYNEDNGILVVKTVSAVALTDVQKQKLIAKLEATTGKTIDLQCSIDSAVQRVIQIPENRFCFGNIKHQNPALSQNSI